MPLSYFLILPLPLCLLALLCCHRAGPVVPLGESRGCGSSTCIQSHAAPGAKSPPKGEGGVPWLYSRGPKSGPRGQ